MSEAEALRLGYAMMDEHDDEFADAIDEDDEFDGFTIEDEDGYEVLGEADENENEWPDDPELTEFFRLYDDGPESTAEPEGL